MAQLLGKKDDAKLFAQRAQNYRNVFDSSIGFMRGKKADGTWRSPFDPRELVWDDFTEATSWNYTWFVPHDVPGLIGLMGGDQATIAKLDQMFSEDSTLLAAVPDMTGLIGQYVHGNEPCHHVAYLYNYAGAPWKTQERIRQVMTALYNNKVDGICGNDDCGQMSAWYVLSALGFYPVNPASRRLRAGQSAGGAGHDPSRRQVPQGPHVHDRGREQLAEEPLHPIGHAQRQAADAELVHACRVGRRRRAGFEDGRRAEQGLGPEGRPTSAGGCAVKH